MIILKITVNTVSRIAFAVDDNENYLKLWKLFLSHNHGIFQVSGMTRPDEYRLPH